MTFMQSNSEQVLTARHIDAPPLASNPDSPAAPIALFGIEILCWIRAGAWLAFLAWVIWPWLVAPTPYATRESKSAIGCFQSVDPERSSETTKCS
jgi:hypothetical protein